MGRVVALLWSIWKNMNNLIFRNELPSLGLVLLRVKRASVEWCIRHKLSHSFQPSSRPPSSCRRKQSRWIAWQKPPEGFVKINFDGSKSSQVAAGGFIIRDWAGRFLQAESFNLGVTSVLVAEATAMRNGVQAAAKAGFTNIHIEGDNCILIQAVKEHVYVPWEIQVLVQDIHSFLQSFTNVVIHHVFQQGNNVADWLAKYGLSILSTTR